MNKKTITFIILILIILAILAGWYFYSKENTISQLEKIKIDNPDLTIMVDDIISWENKLKEDESRVESYATLGLAWKSLADRAKDLKIANYKNYYKKALEVYEQGILVTIRKNTLFLVNAGNMAKYLEDYEQAEDYYKEAISVAPGDDALYILLAELYEYRLNKSQDEITAVYDEGMKRVLSPEFLKQRKEAYLERSNQK